MVNLPFYFLFHFEHYLCRRSDVGNLADGCQKGKFSGNDCVRVQKTSDNSNKLILGKCTSSIPSRVSEQKPMLSEDQLCTPSTSFKRPKKHGLSSGCLEKSKEVICLSSGGESSTMRSVRDHGRFPHRELGSPLAVDECSPEVGDSISQTDNDSETRAIQLQADEMLALELQEQLYNETESTGGEVCLFFVFPLEAVSALHVLWSNIYILGVGVWLSWFITSMLCEIATGSFIIEMVREPGRHCAACYSKRKSSHAWFCKLYHLPLDRFIR